MSETLATHRAILDWYRRPVTIQKNILNPKSEADQKALPGVVGMTKHRIMWQLSPQIVANALRLCAEALADPDLSDGKRSAIAATRQQFLDAQETMDG